jgi:hypothetical protein
MGTLCVTEKCIDSSLRRQDNDMAARSMSNMVKRYGGSVKRVEKDIPYSKAW